MRKYADAHCDTMVKLFEEKKELFLNDQHLDIERLKSFYAPLQCFAIWLDPKYYPISMRQCMRYIDFYYKQIGKNADCIGHINQYADLQKNMKQNKISALLTIEGGEALEGEISALRIYHQLGVRSISLTWNYRNALADGVGECGTGGGLTRFGREVVLEMEKLGMIVDVSHISEVGFWDVAVLANKPFIASHSNAQQICDVARNLTDMQLKIIAEKGGVVGVNLYPPFLTKQKYAKMEDIIKHINHMLLVMGEDYICLGSDFDGIDYTPTEIEQLEDMEVLYEGLRREFGVRIAEKIFSENLIRVIKDVLG